MIRGLKHCGIGPDFRFGRTAATRKNADDFPIVLADADFFSYVEAGERSGRARSSDDFVAAGFPFSALNDFDVLAHCERLLSNAAKGNVRIRAGGTLGKVDDDE